MITIAGTRRFDTAYKKFVKYNAKRAESIIKTIDLFIKDQTHPRLNVEKLQGSIFWTMRIDNA